MSVKSYIKILLICLLFSETAVLAEKRGFVASRRCPFNCRTEKIPAEECRTWSENGICFIEDFRRPPRITAAPYNPFENNTNITSARSDYSDCKWLNKLDMPRTQINILSMEKTGPEKSDTYKIKGSIQGLCLADAVYFEYDRPIKKIPVVLRAKHAIFDFDLLIKANRQPSLRIYNIFGYLDTLQIDPESYK